MFRVLTLNETRHVKSRSQDCALGFERKPGHDEFEGLQKIDYIDEILILKRQIWLSFVVLLILFYSFVHKPFQRNQQIMSQKERVTVVEIDLYQS
jgi:hypothetical protein